MGSGVVCSSPKKHQLSRPRTRGRGRGRGKGGMQAARPPRVPRGCTGYLWEVCVSMCVCMCRCCVNCHMIRDDQPTCLMPLAASNEVLRWVFGGRTLPALTSALEFELPHGPASRDLQPTWHPQCSTYPWWPELMHDAEWDWEKVRRCGRRRVSAGCVRYRGPKSTTPNHQAMKLPQIPMCMHATLQQQLANVPALVLAPTPRLHPPTNQPTNPPPSPTHSLTHTTSTHHTHSPYPLTYPHHRHHRHHPGQHL